MSTLKRDVDRIKKCLALAGSSNANEAAAALRQAQALMRRHGLDEDALAALDVGDELVRTVEGFGHCVFLNNLAALLMRSFGVRAHAERNPGSANRANVRYFGPGGRAKLAGYAHRVIVRSVDAAWREHCLTHPWDKAVGGRKRAFRLGWLHAVRPQVEALVVRPEEDAAMDAWERRETADVQLVVHRPRTVSLDDAAVRAMAQGMAAAGDFRLHAPLEGEAAAAPALLPPPAGD